MKEQITGRKTGQEEQNRIPEKEAAGQKAASFEKAQKKAFLGGLLSGELSLSGLPESFLGRGATGLENSFLETFLSGGSGDAPFLTAPPAIPVPGDEDDMNYVNCIAAPAPLLLSLASLPGDSAAEHLHPGSSRPQPGFPRDTEANLPGLGKGSLQADFPWDAAAEFSGDVNNWHVRGREEAIDG